MPFAPESFVAAAITHGSLIDELLGTVVTMQPLTLYSSAELTVQRIVWPRSALRSVHDHQMWAVVGVYAGCEVNRLYRRSPDGLIEIAGREWTAGLHVYGGNILDAPRRAWDPAGRELPHAEVVQARQTMIKAMRDFATECGTSFNDDDRAAALDALWAECQQRERHLDATEARDVVAASWSGPQL